MPDQDMLTAALPAITAACGLLLALCFFWGAMRFLLRPLRWTARHVTRASEPGPLRLLAAMLIAALFEPAPFAWAWRVFLALVAFLASTVPQAVLLLAAILPDACANGLDAKCAKPFQTAAALLWTGRSPSPLPLANGAAFAPVNAASLTALGPAGGDASSVQSILRIIGGAAQPGAAQQLIVASVIAGIALLVLVAASREAPRLSRVDWGAPAVVAVYKAGVLAASLLFALYLCVTAIVAIPVFNDRTDRVKEGEDYIDKQLPLLKDLYLKNLDKLTVADDGLSIPEDLRSQAEKPTAAAGAPADPKPSLYAQFWLGAEIAALQSRTDEFRDAAERLKIEAGRVQEEADRFSQRLTGFYEQQNTGHIGGALTVQHARSLVGWYGSWLNEYRKRLTDCGSILTRRKEAIQASASDVQREFAVLIKAPDFAVPNRFGPVDDFAACGDFEPDYSDYLIPRQNIGDSLLLFGQATRWLLLTESRDLALIVGLLGFGFFGALASSFIRHARANEPLTDTNLIVPALIRGVAAAVLIFLAVVGGMAVFTRSDPEPNPYAVFLACFIAAVFSEDVWEWAQRRQGEQLGGRNRNGVGNAGDAAGTAGGGGANGGAPGPRAPGPRAPGPRAPEPEPEPEPGRAPG